MDFELDEPGYLLKPEIHDGTSSPSSFPKKASHV
jgi:hypothetical protein